MGTMKNNKTLTIITSNMKTKYLIPQTDTVAMEFQGVMVDTTTPMPEPAPARNGFAPGGGDLGGVPAN